MIKKYRIPIRDPFVPEGRSYIELEVELDAIGTPDDDREEIRKKAKEIRNKWGYE
jgi:hypothetical protein